MLAIDCAQNMIASHELSLYCKIHREKLGIETWKARNVNRRICWRGFMEGDGDRSRNYPEHDAEEAEDDGDETWVIDRQILRRHRRRDVRLRRRWLSWIVRRRWVPVRRHLSPSLSQKPKSTAKHELKEHVYIDRQWVPLIYQNMVLAQNAMSLSCGTFAILKIVVVCMICLCCRFQNLLWEVVVFAVGINLSVPNHLR